MPRLPQAVRAPRRAGRLLLSGAAVALVLFAASAAITTRSRPRSPQLQPVTSSSSVPPLKLLEVKVGGLRRGVLRVADYSVGGVPSVRRLERRLAGLLASTQTATRGPATTVYQLDLVASAVRGAALGSTGGALDVVRRPLSTVVRAPALRQRLRNNCESAALSILMASLGRPVDQLRVQRALRTSGPLDPAGSGATRVWGDPNLGFVGRADGGGTAGGFGVYPEPVREVAARFGTQLRVVTGERVSKLRSQLLAGRPAMLWIGLSAGPYGNWRSPQGREVQVNFGEHTVVIYGVRRDGSFLVSNPLQGTREVWSASRLAMLWQRLGRRALVGA
jgi:uncharacterized protein YvpB